VLEGSAAYNALLYGIRVDLSTTKGVSFIQCLFRMTLAW
jgi:hypothetical protein